MLCSSIFFIDDSVFSGLSVVHRQLGHERTKQYTHDTIVRYSSIRGAWGIDVRGYFGLRGSFKVLGRRNVTERRGLRLACECVPWSAAFLAALALLSLAPALGAEGKQEMCEQQSNQLIHPVPAALPFSVLVLAMDKCESVRKRSVNA